MNSEKGPECRMGNGVSDYCGYLCATKGCRLDPRVKCPVALFKLSQGAPFDLSSEFPELDYSRKTDDESSD